MKLHPYLSDLTQEDDVIAIQISTKADESGALVEAVVKKENSPNPHEVRGIGADISNKESKELIEYLMSRITGQNEPVIVGPFINTWAELVDSADGDGYALSTGTIVGFYDTAVGALTLHSELRCRTSPFGLDRLTVYCEDEKGKKLLPSMHMYNTEIEFDYTKTKFNFK